MRMIFPVQRRSVDVGDVDEHEWRARGYGFRLVSDGVAGSAARNAFGTWYWEADLNRTGAQHC
jgi:hypothetical protein